MKIDPNAPAFPSAMIRPEDYGVQGLTIRAHFAAQVMAHLCGSPAVDATYECMARSSVRAADALIAELNK